MFWLAGANSPKFLLTREHGPRKSAISFNEKILHDELGPPNSVGVSDSSETPSGGQIVHVHCYVSIVFTNFPICHSSEGGEIDHSESPSFHLEHVFPLKTAEQPGYRLP